VGGRTQVEISKLKRGRVLARSWVVGLVLGLLAVQGASAQSTLASVSGVIEDEQHSALPAATITLKNLETGQIRTTTSGPAGSYRILGLRPGLYEIRVGLAGFATDVRDNLSLTLGEDAELAFTLTLAKLTDTITVSGAAALIEPSKTTLGRTLTMKQIEELPVAGRDFTTLALLTPGILENHSSNTVTTAQFAAAGQTGRSTGFLIDGLSRTDIQGAPRAAFSLDAVREFAVLTNGFPAEYGGFSGALVNIVTRSGTNHLAGRGFYYYRDAAWDATPAQARLTVPPLEKTTLAQKTAGGFVGGSLVRDRAFFFGSIEDAIQQTEGIITSPVLQIFEPGAPTHVPLHNNTVEALGRGDVQIVPSNGLMLRYRLVRAVADPRIGAADVGVGAPERAINGLTRTQDIALRDTQSWGSRELNELRFQWAPVSNDLQPTSCPVCPNIDRRSIKLGKNPAVPNGFTETRWQMADTMTYLRPGFGREHLFKIGMDASFIGLDRTGLPNHEGTFRFDNDTPFDPLDGLTYPTQYTRSEGLVFSHEDAALYAAFVQDQWRVQPKVTVNLGVRWDYEHAAGVSRDTANVAPRLAVALGPWQDGRTAIRGSYGRYYDQVPLSIALAADQARTSSQVFMKNPGYPDPDVPNPFAASSGRLPSTTVLANDMQTPSTEQGTVGLQRQLRPRLGLTVDAVWARGRHLLVTQDLNYSDLTDPNPKNRPRPNSQFQQILSVETRGHSWYKALQVGLEQRPVSRYAFTVAYTLSSTERDTEDFDFSPQDQRDFAAERAPSLSDARHRLVASVSLDLTRTLRLTAVTVAQSALPYTITTGKDDNGDGVFNDRPPSVGRNSARGTPFFQTDVRMTKAFRLGVRRVDLLVEAFNVTNRANWTMYDGQQSSSTFGRPKDAAPPRQVQVGARIDF
jgi:hypothetical protein